MVPESGRRLEGLRILTALNGIELFGHERGNIAVFEALRRQGAEVLVGVNDRERNDVAVELGARGFTVFKVRFGSQWSKAFLRESPGYAITNALAVYRSTLDFGRRIRSFRPTHVLLGSPLAFSFLGPALAMSRVPLVFRCGDAPSDSSIQRLILARTLRRAQVGVAISRFVEEALNNTGRPLPRLEVVYNMAPIDDNSPPRRMRGRRADSPLRFLYVGSIAPHKGVDLLLEAFGQVQARVPGVELHVVGGSRWTRDYEMQLREEVLRSGTSDRVHFHGPAEDVRPAYDRADVHLAPSVRPEALGNVVLEAKSRGRPSIVFASGGLPEMVRHEVDGLVCEESSVSALAAAMRWMADHKTVLPELGRAAREDYDRRFGQERFDREWAAVFRSIGGER